MISLLLPYWNRQDAADKAIASLQWQYGTWDGLEVIVIDDGSPVPFRCPPTGLNLRIIRLPEKNEPKSPVTCWNEGARQANGDILVLSCIEVIHTTRVLPQMLSELWRTGKQGYVLAAAWCPETQEWHTHSSRPVPECPEGTGLGFCGMLYSELYWNAGGWDEDYREGAGYEDRDFIHRLCVASARFVIRDDLVVIHPKSGASIAWGADKFARNESLFHSKWPLKAITFVCVNVGNYCGMGAEYVNRLADMVRRNLGQPVKFVCLTDDPTGLDPTIETLPIPADLEGWYGKLYLFKKGLFPDGQRMVYLDLDTVITGALDDIVKYDGHFATLRDFYFPEQVGPAVMLWRSGYANKIWDEWVAQDKPRNPMGDLWWINNVSEGEFALRCDKLQSLYPGAFVSYKADCMNGVPDKAKVVCFHGLPRPHQVTDQWVYEAWRVGSSAKLECIANTDGVTVAANIRASSARDLPWLELKPAHAGIAVLVGGGPSASKDLWEIRGHARQGHAIVSMNGSHAWLLAHDICPAMQVVIDARPENAKFLQEPATSDCKPQRFLASQCAPELFDAATNVTLVHLNTAKVLDSIPNNGQPLNLISCGSTVGLAAMAIAYCQGYREMHLYGYDSSFEDGHHAYSQPGNDADRIVNAEVNGRTFKAAPWMVAQVQQFQELSAQLAEDDCEIHVHGTGLLPYVAWIMAHQQEAA